MKKQTARDVALRALLQIHRQNGYSNIVLDQALNTSGLDSRDGALASAIVYGVLERRITLDYYLSQCLKDPRKKLDPTVQAALRCGAYQILFLDRVPDAAAVNETVNALKNMEKAQFSGFVNGVLRGLIRRKEQIKPPDGDSLRARSLRYGVPQELIGLWQQSYGDEFTRSLLGSLMEKPALYVRINKMKATPQQLKAQLEAGGMELDLIENMDYAAILRGCGAPAHLAAFQEGLFHVQDLSAQMICQILAPNPSDIICDCCAAPGGKSFTLAQEAPGGRIYAFDLYESRVRLIRDGARRLGLDHVEASVNDAFKGFQNFPRFDRILCDVPCSGFGVIRRKPEIRYRPLAEIRDLPKLQYNILLQASRALKSGGVLVYSTCTLNPAENREVAERFLQENSDFEAMNIDLEVTRCVVEPPYMLTMTPFTGASDGFFAAAFQKKQG